MDEPLMPQEAERYARHILLPQVGIEGQLRLRSSSVVVIGAGGLGSPALTYLVAAGVGTVGVVDFDTVDLSNLQRQSLHSTHDIGRAKTESAIDRLSALNPHVEVVRHDVRVDPDTATEILQGYDVVIDGADNFPTRYLVADTCSLLGIPYVWAAVLGFDAMLSVFDPRTGPCLRCLFPRPPSPGDVPSCAESGVLGALPGAVGALQAIEAFKLILGIGRPLIGRLGSFDALDGQWSYLPISRNPSCELCGPEAVITTHSEIRRRWESASGNASCAVSADGALATSELIEPRELTTFLAANPGAVLLDVRTKQEAQIISIPGSRLVPLADLMLASPTDLSPQDPIVTLCKSGARSDQAAAELRARGFGNVWQLRGGILAWIDEVSPNSARY